MSSGQLLHINVGGFFTMSKAIQWIIRGAAILAALLATVQPMLGSFAFFRRGDLIEYETLHLVVGAFIYNVTILLALLAPFSKLPRRWMLFVVSLVQYVL